MASHVAVLLCHPDASVIDAAMRARVSNALGAEARVLAEGIAAEWSVGDPVATRSRLGEIVGVPPVDVAIVPADGRRKRLLIADMDSTMIEQECIDELAAEVGRKDEVAAITAAAMRGEIEFEPALRKRVATLGGLPVSVVDTVLRERIVLRSGGRELVGTMRANGAHTMLVSGGFTLFTEAIAAAVGFDEHQANVLGVEADRFSGTVHDPILGSDAKLAALRTALRERGLTADDALAVGDGANDLPMIEASGLGVALHAKPAVAARAAVRIDHGDLTALLYLQGYARDEFAT